MISVWYFPIFYISLLQFSFCLWIFLLTSASLWSLFWILYQVNQILLRSVFFLFISLKLTFWSFILLFCSCYPLHLSWLCVGFWPLDKTAKFRSLDGVVSYRKWTSSMNPAQALGCLSNLCDCPGWFLFFLAASSCSVFQDLSVSQRGESQSSSRLRLTSSWTPGSCWANM